MTQPNRLEINSEQLFSMIGKLTVENQLLGARNQELEQLISNIKNDNVPIDELKFVGVIDKDNKDNGIMKFHSKNDLQEPCSDCKDSVVVTSDAPENVEPLGVALT